MAITVIVIALCAFLWLTRDTYSDIEALIVEHEENKKAIEELQAFMKTYEKH